MEHAQAATQNQSATQYPIEQTNGRLIYPMVIHRYSKDGKLLEVTPIDDQALADEIAAKANAHPAQ